MLVDWLIYIVIGRVLIYTGMKFPLPKFLEKQEKIKRLHECDFCFGVWVYGILSFVLQMELLKPLGFFYFPFLSELITGCVISLLVHLVILGWKAQFEVIVV